MPDESLPSGTKITANDPETQSANLVGENLERLKALFPDAFREGKVDFDVLRQLLGGAVDEREEKYGLNWHGKRQARQIALTPSVGTLRPCPEESVDWDTTQNLMIEGDNLEVLKLLQKSYAGKVKLIYIDPPYNTGKDFVYPDNFKDSIKSYLELTGQGKTLVSNPETSGRHHSDWLSMIYPRLRLAWSVLAKDGVILISVDEHEVGSLRHVCEEIFGEENAIGTLVWKGATDNNPTQIAMEHEYMLCFARAKGDVASVWKNATDQAKQILLAEFNRMKQNPLLGSVDVQKSIRQFIKANRESLSAITHYDRVDDVGLYTGSRKVHNPKPGGYVYDVVHPATKKVCVPPVNGYRYPKDRMGDLIAADRILFGEDETQIVQVKEYLQDYEGKLSSVFHLDSRTGANETQELFGVQKLFSNPKPVSLLSDVFEFILDSRSIVLDFFAGSGSTAQAIWSLNLKDNGRRRVMLVQLPEPLDLENKDQKVAASFCDSHGKPRTIAELTKERLRRAGAKIRNENPLFKGDTGFRVFKLDSSNIRTWDPNRDKLAETLHEHAEHLLPGRTEQDVLFELLIKLGLDLTVPIVSRTIAGKTVHSIGAGALMVSLADGLTRDSIEDFAQGILTWRSEIAPPVSTSFVFKDSGFVDDVAKLNLVETLKQGLPSDQIASIRSV